MTTEGLRLGRPWSRLGSGAFRGALCLSLAVFPATPRSQQETQDPATVAVLWEAAPVVWIEQGEVVLHEAERFDLGLPADLSGDDPARERPASPTPAAFSTGFGLELRAERTLFDAKGRAASTPRSVPHGGIWVATTLARDIARPHIEAVIDSLAAGPLSRFEKRVPTTAGEDSARFFTFAGSPFFTETPTWICYELPDERFVGRTLAGEPWTTPAGAAGLRTSIGSASAYDQVCRSIRETIRSQARGSTSYPTRLVSERKPRRRLVMSLFRSYRPTSEVAAGGSRLSLGREITSSSMPSHPDLDPWLARSAPVVMRFALEEAGDEKRCQWTTLGDWLVALHLPKVERPDGGVEEDALRWEQDVVELARTAWKENLAQALRGVSVLDPSDLQSAPHGPSEGFKGGILLESLAAFLGKRSAVAVVCHGGSAVYSLFPSPATWMPVRNGGEFCDELDHTLRGLEPVPVE